MCTCVICTYIKCIHACVLHLLTRLWVDIALTRPAHTHTLYMHIGLTHWHIFTYTIDSYIQQLQTRLYIQIPITRPARRYMLNIHMRLTYSHICTYTCNSHIQHVLFQWPHNAHTHTFVHTHATHISGTCSSNGHTNHIPPHQLLWEQEAFAFGFGREAPVAIFFWCV